MTIRKFVRIVSARKVGRSKWVASCPAHTEAATVLTIHQWRRGPIELECSAGCDLDEILAALGLGDNGDFVAIHVSRKEARRRARERVNHSYSPTNESGLARSTETR